MVYSKTKVAIVLFGILLLGCAVYLKLQNNFLYLDPLNRFTFNVPGKWLKEKGMTFCYKDGTVNFTKTYKLSLKEDFPVLSILSADNNTFIESSIKTLPKIATSLGKESCALQKDPYLYTDGQTCSYDYDLASKRLIKVFPSPKMYNQAHIPFTSSNLYMQIQMVALILRYKYQPLISKNIFHNM